MHPKERLLSEYAQCQTSAEGLEATIWRSAEIAGIGSLASLVALAALKAPLLPAALSALAVVTGTLVWWAMARRWWTIQHVKYSRMLEIERELEIPGQVSMVRYLDDLSDIIRRGKHPRTPSHARSLRAARRSYHVTAALALQLCRSNWRDFKREGPREILPWLVRVNISIWLVYVGVLAFFGPA